MQFSNSQNIKTQIGYVAGSLCKSNYLRYCPECAKHEASEYGEPYFHRLHQIQGVLVCPEHNIFLHNYDIGRNSVSRLKYIPLVYDSKSQNDKIHEVCDVKLLLEIAVGFNYLLNNTYKSYNQYSIHERYINALMERGLTTINGSIKQIQLQEEFMNLFQPDLLSKLDSSIDVTNEYNWLKVISRKPKRVVHPLRHVMMMIFLFGSVENYFKRSEKERNDKMEQIGYPCLNPACPGYNRNVISIEKITYDSKSKKYIGTYCCACGFEYSRAINSENYKRIRIKNYGNLWEMKLKELVCQGNNSVRYIAKILKCDSKTVKKYAEKMGLLSLLDVKLIECTSNSTEVAKAEVSKTEDYKKSIVQFIGLKPECSIKDIRTSLGKEYTWLYRHEKDWLVNALPQRKTISCIPNTRVDWVQRDQEILGLLVDEYKKIICKEVKVRITVSMLGRRINKQSLLEKKLNKLPESEKFLKTVCETSEDYHKRRIRNVISLLREEKQELKKWKIVRLAGVRSEYLSNLDDYIEKVIS